MNEDIKVELERKHQKHGRFTKTWVIHTDKLPICCECNEEIENNTYIYWCKQNPNQFWHIDCFDPINHNKDFDGTVHEDYYGILINDLK